MNDEFDIPEAFRTPIHTFHEPARVKIAHFMNVFSPLERIHMNLRAVKNKAR